MKFCNINLFEAKQKFCDFLSSHNHPLDDGINDDSSKFHYLKCPHGSSTDARYKFYSDSVPSGFFQCWHCDIKASFCSIQKQDIPSELWETHIKKMEECKLENEQETQKKQAEIAELAKAVFLIADEETAAEHDYLQLKQVKNHGLRALNCETELTKKAQCYRGTLLVPCCNIDNEIVNLERIYYSSKENKFLKRPLTGAQRSKTFFIVGKIAEKQNIFYFSEGIATASTAYEATGIPTVASFNCGNLLHVIRIFRQKYPEAQFIIVADNDQWNEDPNLRDSGIKAAKKACSEINNVRYVLPDFGALRLSHEKLAELKPTDINDLFVLLVKGGLEKSSALTIVQKQLTISALPENFYLNDKGLFFKKEDKDGNGDPVFICSGVEITAYLCDGSSNNWGRLLEFKDAAKTHHTWGMPMSMLKGSGEELRGELLNRGLHLGHGNLAKNKFLEYITCTKPTVFARCVARVGWHREGDNRVFVLPDKTIGYTEEKIVYQTESPNACFKVSGTIDDWKENVAKYCAGNSRLVLAVSTAFASMLLEPAGEEPGGINYFGTSSAGKTTSLIVAGSVYSDPSFLSRWRATVNGLEALASARNDCLLTLDEFAQVEPKEAGNAIYTLANGSGKARANQHGGARPQNGWRILFLSSGEIDLNQHIADGGKKITAGQQVRCIDISADAGAGLGMFENLHELNSGDAFSIHLKEMCARHYGTACISFLEIITVPDTLNSIIMQLKEVRQKFIDGLKIESIGGQVRRVANRLALIAYAGEIATAFGLTGWEEGEAVKAAQICMKSWIKHRGGTDNSEKAALLSQVKGMIEKHGDSRFENFDATGIQPLIRDRLGFKRKMRNQTDDVYWYYVLTDGFTELHKGYTKTFAINTLKEAGWLDINEMKEASQSIHIPAFGKKTRCYVLTDAIWDDQKK